jgi:hypothetical protein
VAGNADFGDVPIMGNDLRRRVSWGVRQLTRHLDDSSLSDTELLARVKTALAAISRILAEGDTGQSRPITAFYPDIVDSLKKRRTLVQDGGNLGLPSSISWLDTIIGGFQPGLHVRKCP